MRSRSCESPARRRASRQAGFAYVALMIAVATIGLAAAATLQAGSLLARREAEQVLLDCGRDFRAALDDYARATPAGQPSAPPALASLLRDPRFPGIVRHLRRVPYDPMTGKAEWGLAMTPDGQGIAGIHSLSTARPIKRDGFEPGLRNLRDADSYAEWVFMPTPVR